MMEEQELEALPARPTTVDRRRQQTEAAPAACSAAIVVMMLLQQGSMQQEEEQAVEPKVKKTQTARRLFNCEGAYNCIMRDHLGLSNPLYEKNSLYSSG